MLDIIRSDHLRSCPGSQDDQAKVRRLDQAGDDHVKIHWIHIVDGSEIPAIHLGCLKPVVNNEIFTYQLVFSPDFFHLSWTLVGFWLQICWCSCLEALETPCVRYERAATPRLMQAVSPVFLGPLVAMVAMVACCLRWHVKLPLSEENSPRRTERYRTFELRFRREVIVTSIMIWVFPKIGFSIINHPFWGTPIFGNTHLSWFNFSCQISLDVFHWESPFELCRTGKMPGKSRRKKSSTLTDQIRLATLLGVTSHLQTCHVMASLMGGHDLVQTKHCHSFFLS